MRSIVFLPLYLSVSMSVCLSIFLSTSVSDTRRLEIQKNTLDSFLALAFDARTLNYANWLVVSILLCVMCCADQ